MHWHICGQCRQIRRSLRTASTALPPSHCALPPRFALPPLLLMLLPPPRCHQAATDVALLGYRHHCSIRTAATVLPPSRCAPPPCRRQAAANIALALVDCYISVNSVAFLSPYPTPFLSIHPRITPYCACHTNHDKTLCGVVRVVRHTVLLFCWQFVLLFVLRILAFFCQAEH